ncbi:MAG TPA: HEAT repeat domain-containing protein, partial [Candidatus Obscuribacterales bacterium]
QRMALSENLGRLPAKKTYELARRLLDDPSPEVREAVLRSLDPTASEQMQELLLDGSRDSDAWVRQAAVEALGKLQKSETRGRILELLAQDEDFLVRAAAAEALAGHQVEDVRQALIEALKDAKPSVRLQATHALFAHEQLPTVTLLAQLLADEDKSVVLATLQQLRQSAQPELKAQLQPQLEPLLQSEDLQISSAAAGLS